MGRKRGGRFQKVSDAQEQLESLEKAQQKVREGKLDKRIRSIEKSKKRLENSFRKIRRPKEVVEEFEEK